MRYAICRPDYDETHWVDFDGTPGADVTTIAEDFARSLCERDPECYAEFQGGAVVLVRAPGARTVVVRVTVESVPMFSATVVHGA
jgi:hypothetical protein